jgi:hypothetical protein
MIENGIKYTVRKRNISHSWQDKEITRFLRHTFSKLVYGNLVSVYRALTEMDSDFNYFDKDKNRKVRKLVTGFASSIETYSGKGTSTVRQQLLFFEELKLFKLKTVVKNGRTKGKKLMMYKWNNQEDLFYSNPDYFIGILNGKYTRTGDGNRTIVEVTNKKVESKNIFNPKNKNIIFARIKSARRISTSIKNTKVYILKNSKEHKKILSKDKKCPLTRTFTSKSNISDSKKIKSLLNKK